MQAVPSLVGSGTAVAAAASGLVLGQPSDSDCTSRHSSTRLVDHECSRAHHDRHSSSLATSARPATSAAPSIAEASIYSHTTVAAPPQSPSSRPPLSRHFRPQTAQVSSPTSAGRRQSFARQTDLLPSAGTRDSLSSNSSWIKRLSGRPLSQQGSPRSSLIADSTSLTLSLSSAAPILPRAGLGAASLPPNKLVKRAPSTHNNSGDGYSDATPRGFRGHLPSLRRPATSHQRSATLQQFRADIDVGGSAAKPKYSFEQPIWPEELLGASPSELSPRSWASFFHTRTRRRPSQGEANSPCARVCLESDSRRQRVHLVKPSMLSSLSAPVASQADLLASKSRKGLLPAPDMGPSRRSKRSLSTSLSSAGNWVSSRTTGSLRRPKWGADGGSSAKEWLASDAVAMSPQSAAGRQHQGQMAQGPTQDKAPNVSPAKQAAAAAATPTVHYHHHHHHYHHHHHHHAPKRHSHGRNSSSSPLAPLASHFSASLAKPTRPKQPSGSSTSSAATSHLVRTSHYERCSAMDSSDGDARGFTSGDDDDMDRDTVFDSLRTLTSCRVRAVDTPLESVYDESPPSTAGNFGTARLFCPDMAGARRSDGQERILEEEDDMDATPIRSGPKASRHSSWTFTNGSAPACESRVASVLSHKHVSQAAKDLSRLSLDDESEDWTKDADMASVKYLSLGSQNSTLTCHGIDANVRLVLDSIEGASDGLPRKSSQQRPVSNLFDWREQTAQDGGCLRPRTAYAGGTEMDGRGGRLALRKGPVVAHVRSQSVPVVNDLGDDARPCGAKYSTWGTGIKSPSEDWDDDFEFGGSSAGTDGNGGPGTLIAVPESIRATQPSVKAHSGQIRELSLLVNDLKRLCRHGRELGMLHGESKGLWKEAEGIIALASPDDEDSNDEDTWPSSSSLDGFEIHKGRRQVVEGRVSLERAGDASLESSAMSRTAVVRERPSPRRRSVLSPDDDMFGSNWPLVDDSGACNAASRPPTPADKMAKAPTGQGKRTSSNRVHFDTNSLKALVRRAGELRDVLSDIVRRADRITQSPLLTPPRLDRRHESPAFTRVFDDPLGSSPRSAPKSRRSSSTVDATPSPASPPGRPIALMTVK
ncbi:hypothetical protein CDD81_897 [Ophiocordyceps australis]|uniref:Uncharacterized protein n=1 Tax=Ophiocordyceps australis TaxID=1399860 RepID=A0A2C5XBC8_9HYPO|nr:hypothetical protein CDD81_897 [Ophiocordyceps australis]